MIRKFFAVIALLFITVSMVSAVFLVWQWRAFDQRNLVPDQPTLLEIRQGSGLKQVIQALVDRRVLHSDLEAGMFEALIRYREADRRLRAGEYELPVGSRATDIIDHLVRGDVRLYSLTIVEGWTFAQMRQVLNEHPKLKHETLDLTDLAILQSVEKSLKPANQHSHPEGLFFPDTYRFPANTPDLKIYRQAYEAMQMNLQTQWEKRLPNLPYKNAYEALIMASIVEKETGLDSEREEIAGVFVRRLNKRMRLQTDPTVIYGIGPSFDGDIRYRDLRRDTPYNTYTRHGLPPSPIALPGLRSIEAAMNPDSGKSLYFVAKGNGAHQFSENLAAHQAAVRRYQLRQSGP